MARGEGRHVTSGTSGQGKKAAGIRVWQGARRGEAMGSVGSTMGGAVLGAARATRDVAALVDEARGHPHAVARKVPPHLLPVLPLVVHDRVAPVFLFRARVRVSGYQTLIRH